MANLGGPFGTQRTLADEEPCGDSTGAQQTLAALWWASASSGTLDAKQREELVRPTNLVRTARVRSRSALVYWGNHSTVAARSALIARAPSKVRVRKLLGVGDCELASVAAELNARFRQVVTFVYVQPLFVQSGTWAGRRLV